MTNVSERASFHALRRTCSIGRTAELRENHGLTQSLLAERCGIDQGDISRIERGATTPTAPTLQRIAEALNADVRLVAWVVRRTSTPAS